MTGLELKKRRKSLGLTQKQLAEKLGYTEHYVWMMENGSDIKKPIPIDIILCSLENNKIKSK